MGESEGESDECVEESCENWVFVSGENVMPSVVPYGECY